MKKLYFLISMLFLCSFSGMAQTSGLNRFSLNRSSGSLPIQKQNLYRNTFSEMKLSSNINGGLVTSNKLEGSFFKNTSTRADDVDVFYPVPYGTYKLGMVSQNGALYDPYPIIVAPAYRDLNFYPYVLTAGTEISWTLNGVDASDFVNDEGTFVHFGVPNVGLYMPKLHGRLNSSTASYMYGEYDTEGNSIDQQFILSSSIDIAAISHADVTTGALYGGVTSDFFFSPSCKFENENCTGIVTVYEQPLAPLYVRDIDVLVYNRNETGLANLIPAGKSMTMNVYYIYENEGFTRNHLVASATATQENITNFNGGYNFINFKFYDIDEDGFVADKTLLLQDAVFAVELTDFDETYDFAIPVSVNNDNGGSAYAFFGDNKDGLVSYNEDGFNLIDMHVYLNAAYSCLEVADEAMEVAVDGGYVVNANNEYGVVLYSSTPYEDLKVTSSSWIKITEVDESYFETVGGIVAIAEGEALPAGVTGRSGEIVFAAEGITTKVIVYQGDVTSISSIEVESIEAIAKGDSYELSYPSGLNSVSVINVAGQIISTYDLPSNGTFTLPAAELTNGIYILKFNGEQSATVKILK